MPLEVTVCEMFKVHYRKMTNGFVFRENSIAAYCSMRRRVEFRKPPFDPQWQDITTLVRSLICHGFGWLSRKRIYFVMAQLLHP